LASLAYSPTYDIDNDPRPLLAGPDLGADEFAPTLISTDPPADATLPRTANNVIRFTYDVAISLPPAPALSILPIAGGPDLGGSFTYSLDAVNLANDTLVARENGTVLTDQTWYRLSPAPGSPLPPFSLDLCTLRGDADNSGQVLAPDYAPVRNNLFLLDPYHRADLDGSGQVLAPDYVVVRNHLFTTKPPKP
jgi:hypothetical protein